MMKTNDIKDQLLKLYSIKRSLLKNMNRNGITSSEYLIIENDLKDCIEEIRFMNEELEIAQAA